MDVTTIVGIGTGFFLIIFAIIRGGGIGVFINPNAMMITGGGTLAAVLISYPLPEVIRVIKVLPKAFMHKPIIPLNTINFLVAIAGKARREGFIALEEDAKKADNEFLRLGLQFAIAGTSPESSRRIMESEIENLEERHMKGEGVFRAAGKFAPAFGMLGTLIGLIQMLRTLEDPSTIGAGMAVALVTTLYGVILANLIFLPIAGKLRVISEEEVLERRFIIEGILSVQSGDTPMVVEDKLRSYLPPSTREKIVRRRRTTPTEETGAEGTAKP